MKSQDNLICYRSEFNRSPCLNFRYLPTNGEITEALVIDNGDAIVAFNNICPHQQVQLSWGQDDWYNADSDKLFCIFHGALFQMPDGLCVKGPCLGQHLQPVAIEVSADAVWLSTKLEKYCLKFNGIGLVG